MTKTSWKYQIITMKYLGIDKLNIVVLKIYIYIYNKKEYFATKM